MTELTLVNLTKTYAPGIPAVNELNLTVRHGELMVLLGPSGVGKTTALRLVAGLLRPTAGDLRFDGRSVRHLPPEERGAVMVFQEHLLFPFSSVGDNVAFGLRMRRLDRQTIRTRVNEALAAVQLDGFEDRWPDELSGGQRQRASLARALAVRPNVLLLDEPLSNLDRGLREEMREMIRRVQQTYGITTLFVTHDQAEAVAIADRIALLFDGRLRQLGTPRDFYDHPVDQQTARFFGGVNFLPGCKRGLVVETAVGSLQLAPSTLPDGPVLLTIRPEAILIGSRGHNDLNAQVCDHHYRGATAVARLSVQGVDFYAAVPPHQPLAAGSQVALHLPPQRLCLLPYTEDIL